MTVPVVAPLKTVGSLAPVRFTTKVALVGSLLLAAPSETVTLNDSEVVVLIASMAASLGV